MCLYFLRINSSCSNLSNIKWFSTCFYCWEYGMFNNRCIDAICILDKWRDYNIWRIYISFSSYNGNNPIVLVIFQSWTLNIIYCGLAVLLFGIFLIVDTQMIKEGKYDSISEDDYIIGALFIYIDIILLLNKILSFLQKSKRRRIRRK